MRSIGVLRGLVGASHPGPSAAVTALTAALGWAAGLRGRRLATLAGAVGTGQLSIGWSNDVIDRQRDVISGRRDKPLATGDVGVSVLRPAIGGALISTAVLSARCGPGAGLVHGILVVGSGWAYNLGLKRTRASFVPYAAAFGALPQVATLSGALPRTAPLAHSAAGAMLGVAAHLLNVLPDLADDRLTGVRGLPHRLTAVQLKVAAAALLLAAGALVTRPLPPSARAACGVGLAGLGAGIARGDGRVPFACAVGSAGLDVAALIVAGRRSAMDGASDG